MSRTRFVFTLIFIVGIGIGAFIWGPDVYGFIVRTRCAEPKKYSINSIDARFHLTREQFLDAVHTASDNWSRAYGAPLFMYDPAGELDFNLVFDERQGLSSEIKNLEGDLNTKKDDLVPEIAEYERLVEIYKKKAKDLNEEILYYNNQGGAPEEKFNEIIERQKALQKEAESLNQLASRLNQSTQDYNSEVGQLNSTVKTFNTTLEYKPEQGIYAEGDERVEIYFTTDEKELIHTIMHEMGHALGLDHLQGQKDIMYSYTSKTTEPTQEDIDALRTVCAENIIFERYRRNILYLKQMIDQKTQGENS